MTSRLETAAFLLALGYLPGVGPQTVARAARAYPTYHELANASDAALATNVGSRGAAAIEAGLLGGWTAALVRAEAAIEHLVGRSITPISIVDQGYPPLLRLIRDPPPILYVRGDERVLTSTRMVAVVGTRQATHLGLLVAGRVAQHFAEAGYVIVSGLAKGIDTAAHEGALMAGRTVAVLGTPLDKIYPAENKQLAARISDQGVLISEYPLGTPNRAQAFVERDRLQSGMSLAVIPVQTGLTGGTQHTIRFAEGQGRLLLCPRPQPPEEGLEAYDGIRDLIASGRARAFDAGDYEQVVVSLRETERELAATSDQWLTDRPSGPAAGMRKRPRKTQADPVDNLLLFSEPVSGTGSPVDAVPGDNAVQPPSSLEPRPETL